MDDVGLYIFTALLSFVFLMLAMLFSSVGVCISEIGEGRIKKLLTEEDSSKKARLISQLKACEFDFLVFCQATTAFFVFASSLLFTFSFSKLFASLFLDIYALFTASRADMLSSSVTVAPAIVFALLISSFFGILLGIVLPKKLGLKNPEKTIFSLIGIFKFICVFVKPFGFLLFKTARGILRLLKVDPNLQTGDVTEEDIRMLVDEGNENGTIEFSEREMINNIFEFDDREVGDVMTHRTELAAVSKTDSLETVVAVALEEGFSRIPIYNEDVDDIVGILYVKDLLSLLGTKILPQKTAQDYMRPVIYVPESTRCRMLFREFKSKKTHMAVVVDEYGGTAGIVTMEDLLESIVGSIQDEYDEEDEEINRIDENTYILQGSVSVEEISELFELPYDEDDSPDTLGGLIANTLGHIPEEDEMPTVTIENVSFTVLTVEERRIISVKAVILPKEKTEKIDS